MPVTVAINSCVAGPARLSVSEPINAAGSITYDDYEKKVPTVTKDHNGKYMTGGSTSAAFDIPFEQQRAKDNPNDPDNVKLATNQRRGDFSHDLFAAAGESVEGVQRRPHDADYNPYRTIDSMPVDLTVFNGVTDKKDPAAGDNTTVAHFETQQRGEHNFANDPIDATGLNQNMNLWTQEMPVDKTTWDTTSHDVTGHYFNKGLKHSLGYLNQPFGGPEANGTTGEKGLPSANSQYGPFPWLTWNNRPYVSPLELMLVPLASSSQLLGKYKITHAAGDNPYTTPTVPFPHLMNLFPSGSPPGNPDEELHRILEYLDVPSPFVGTRRWANPNGGRNSAGTPSIRRSTGFRPTASRDESTSTRSMIRTCSRG